MRGLSAIKPAKVAPILERNRFLKEPVLFAWSRRTLAIGAMYIATVAWFYYPVTSREAPIQRLYRTAGAEFDGDHPNVSVTELGLFAHLLVAAPEFFPELPVDYGDRALFLEHFRSTAGTEPASRASSPQPNIVVVLSESFFDPRRLNVSIEPTVLTQLDDLANQADYHGTLTVLHHWRRDGASGVLVLDRDPDEHHRTRGAVALLLARDRVDMVAGQAPQVDRLSSRRRVSRVRFALSRQKGLQTARIRRVH